jgi:hypothetical protein
MAKRKPIQVEIPGDPAFVQMPKALHDRLHDLLDKQDRDGKLTAREKREATALVEMVDRLSLLSAQARYDRRRGA